MPKKGEQQDSVLSALDFAQTRSKRDAELLWEAKYGEVRRPAVLLLRPVVNIG